MCQCPDSHRIAYTKGQGDLWKLYHTSRKHGLNPLETKAVLTSRHCCSMSWSTLGHKQTPIVLSDITRLLLIPPLLHYLLNNAWLRVKCGVGQGRAWILLSCMRWPRWLPRAAAPAVRPCVQRASRYCPAKALWSALDMHDRLAVSTYGFGRHLLLH